MRLSLLQAELMLTVGGEQLCGFMLRLEKGEEQFL